MPGLAAPWSSARSASSTSAAASAKAFPKARISWMLAANRSPEPSFFDSAAVSSRSKPPANTAIRRKSVWFAVVSRS